MPNCLPNITFYRRDLVLVTIFFVMSTVHPNIAQLRKNNHIMLPNVRQQLVQFSSLPSSLCKTPPLGGHCRTIFEFLKQISYEHSCQLNNINYITMQTVGFQNGIEDTGLSTMSLLKNNETNVSSMMTVIYAEPKLTGDVPLLLDHFDCKRNNYVNGVIPISLCIC